MIPEILRNCNQLIWLFTSYSIRLLKQKHLKEDQINWLQFLSTPTITSAFSHTLKAKHTQDRQ